MASTPAVSGDALFPAWVEEVSDGRRIGKFRGYAPPGGAPAALPLDPQVPPSDVVSWAHSEDLHMAATSGSEVPSKPTFSLAFGRPKMAPLWTIARDGLQAQPLNTWVVHLHVLNS